MSVRKMKGEVTPLQPYITFFTPFLVREQRHLQLFHHCPL